MKRPRSNRAWVTVLACVALAIAAIFGVACEFVSHSGDFQTSSVTVVNCPTGQVVCSAADAGTSACVGLATDLNNCGTCGNACPATEVCSGGMCVCPSGTTACGDAGACANVTNDPSNCGACGTVCGPESICQTSTCTPLCQVGQTNCSGFVADGGGACVDVSSDTANCGACGASCGKNELCHSARCCVSGTPGCSCDIDAGETNCGAAGCFNVENTYAHCGDCKTSCVSTQQCLHGRCACPGSEILCGDVCVGCTGGTCNGDSCQCPPNTIDNGGTCCAQGDIPGDGKCCTTVTVKDKPALECCDAGMTYCMPASCVLSNTGSSSGGSCKPGCNLPGDCVSL